MIFSVVRDEIMSDAGPKSRLSSLMVLFLCEEGARKNSFRNGGSRNEWNNPRIEGFQDNKET